MTTKSSAAKNYYVPAPSRRSRSATTLLAQMADLQRGERMKGLREDKHLSQPAVVDLLEKKAGAKVVTLRGYQAWEAGGGIKWENVKVLADVHGVAPEWIMSGDEERPPTPDLSLVTPDDDGLARIQQRLDQLEIAVDKQNENLQEQTKLLADIREERTTIISALEDIRALVAVIPSSEEVAELRRAIDGDG